MNCNLFRVLLSYFEAEELTQGWRAGIAFHKEICDDCIEWLKKPKKETEITCSSYRAIVQAKDPAECKRTLRVLLLSHVHKNSPGRCMECAEFTDNVSEDEPELTENDREELRQITLGDKKAIEKAQETDNFDDFDD